MQELVDGDYARAGAIDAHAWNLFRRYFGLATVVVFLSNIVVASIVAFFGSLASGKGMVIGIDFKFDMSITSIGQFVVGMVLSAILFRAVLGSQIGKPIDGIKLLLARTKPLPESLVQEMQSGASGTKE